VNLTEWGKSVKVAPNEVKFASPWLWSSFSYLWRAYKIMVEINTQRKFTPRVYGVGVGIFKNNQITIFPWFTFTSKTCMGIPNAKFRY